MKLFIFILLFPLFTFALNVPNLTGPVVDLTNTLTVQENEQLSKAIRDYYNKTSNQIAVLLIPSLNKENLEEYSMKVATTWALGSKEKDNGVLYLFVVNDKKRRIEVGQGLEPYLTDIESHRIFDQSKPRLIEKRYSEAIMQDVSLIMKTIDHNSSPDVIAQKEKQHLLDLQQVENQQRLNSLIWKIVYYSFSIVFFGYHLMNYLMFPITLRKKKKELNDVRMSIIRLKQMKQNLQSELVKIEKQYYSSGSYERDRLENIFNSNKSEYDQLDREISELMRIAHKYDVKVG